MTSPTIKPYATLGELHTAARDAFCQLVRRSIDSNGVVRVSLSGGSTPKRLYELLAECDLPWSDIHWFWGDERNVPQDHLDSNYKMVRAAILDRVHIPKSNIHPVPINVDQPQQAATDYANVLREHFPDQAFPRWDLALLGMGDDAHTASLFPGTSALDETKSWFVANWVEKFDAYRYTLTAPAINSANEIWFLVAGAGKRDALSSVLSGDQNPSLYPSQLIKPTRWFVTADTMA